MLEYSNNKINYNISFDKKDKYNHFNRQSEVKKFLNGNMKLKKLKTNIFAKEEPKIKIYNKRSTLNRKGNSLFTNNEIKKYINETNKSSFYKGSEYSLGKMSNTNDIGIRNIIIHNLNINNNYIKEPPLKKQKELKEESTNTYFKDFVNNNNDSDTQRLNSLDSNKNNIQENKIIEPKTTINKRNKYKILFENLKEINKSQKKEVPIKNIFNKTINHINNISINNNIKFHNAPRINNFQYYLELYNFHLLQGIIQNKSHLFNLKNKNFFKPHTPKRENNINLSFFLNQSINNKVSLRELYRNLNKENKSFNILSVISKKKKRKKTYEGKKYNKIRNMLENNSKYNLMNVQYNLEGNKTSKFIKNNIELFSKKIVKIIKNKKKDENKNEFQRKNKIKTSINFNKNIFRKKNENIMQDELDKGLRNSSFEIKSFLHHDLKK